MSLGIELGPRAPKATNYAILAAKKVKIHSV